MCLSIYRFKGTDGEREVIWGTDGSDKRPDDGMWERTGDRIPLTGDIDYMKKFFEEGRQILDLIIYPATSNGRRPYVGTDPESGIQFTIAAKNEQSFIEIVKAMTK